MTSLTPLIEINELENSITISGNSLPENPLTYYQPIFDYLNESKLAATAKHIVVNIDVDLFGSSSLKTIVEIFNILNQLEQLNITHHIDWYYEDKDEDTLEKGEMAASIIPVKISFKKK
jgi:SiaC family regulatory phosphoprotein